MSWPKVALLDAVSDKSSGHRKLKTDEYQKSGLLPIVDQGASGIAGYFDDQNAVAKVELPVVIFGDHTKHIKYAKEPFVVGADGVKILSPNKGVDARYLYHFLLTVHLPEVGYSRHFKYLKEVKIPLPPLEEQKRIAAILDKADELRRLRRRAIERLDTLAQSIFYDMFGNWRFRETNFGKVTLGEKLDFLTSGSRGWAKYYSEKGAPFIRIQNVGRNRFFSEDLAFVEAPDSAEAKRTRVQPGDVLMSITADLGRCAVVPEEIGDAYINQHLTILRSSHFNPHFLSAALSSQSGQIDILKKDRAAVKSGLNFDDIRNVEVIDPPRNLQDEYERRVSKVTKQNRKFTMAEQNSNALFASLQQRAFRGEL